MVKLQKSKYLLRNQVIKQQCAKEKRKCGNYVLSVQKSVQNFFEWHVLIRKARKFELPSSNTFLSYSKKTKGVGSTPPRPDRVNTPLLLSSYSPSPPLH